MASYTGTARGQTLGPSLDLTGTRDLPDPTPGHMALFTDIDRGQWSLMNRWGNPGTYAAVEVLDGGTTGSAGSFAAVTNVMALPLLVPARVEFAHLCVYYTGAIKVVFQTTADSTGSLLTGAAMVGSGSFDDPAGAASMSTSGVYGTGTLSSRALKLASGSADCVARHYTVQISITRTDLTVDDAGFGGIVWGVRFTWDRPALTTFKAGDTADTFTV